MIAFCWRNEDVFLKPLAHKFLKLSLQVFAKFHAWLNALCSEDIKLTGPTPSSEGSKGVVANHKKEASSSSKGKLIPWKLSTEELVLASCDIRRLCYWINHHVSPFAEKLISSTDDEKPDDEKPDELESKSSSSSLITECFQEASNQLMSLNSICWKEISHQLSCLCCEKLEAVKSVASSFRMTNKPAPTTCSPFLPFILGPLKDFDDVYGSKAYDEDLDQYHNQLEKKGIEEGDGGRCWREIAVKRISRAYCDIVIEVLTTARSMDDALRKRKKNQKSENQGLSDAEKIGLQVCPLNRS